jgi:GNAT superfamily N-acetyltransferase
MVVVNKKTGNLYLVDFKTVRVTGSKTAVDKLNESWDGKSKKEGYSKQQNASRLLIEKNEGIKFKGMSLMTIEVRYPEFGKETSGAKVSSKLLPLKNESVEEVFPKSYSDQINKKPNFKPTPQTNSKPTKNQLAIARKRNTRYQRVSKQDNLNLSEDNIKEGVEWIKKTYPKLPVKIVSKIADMDKNTLGIFRNAMIEIKKKARRGTPYHEAFHAVFNTYFDSKMQDALLEEIKEYNVDAIRDLYTDQQEIQETKEPIKGEDPATVQSEEGGRRVEDVYTSKSGEEFKIDIYDGENGRVKAPEKRKDKTRLSLAVSDNNGMPVGILGLWENKDGTWYANIVDVHESHRRKGIATAMYDFAERHGFEIVDSKEQTKEGKAFKENRKANKDGNQIVSEEELIRIAKEEVLANRFAA